MDNSVAAIIEMDKKARAAAAEAEKKAEAILAAAAEEREKTARENAGKLSEQMSARMAEIKASSDRDIEAAENAAEEKCRLLDEKMAAGRETWKKEITGRILDLG